MPTDRFRDRCTGCSSLSEAKAVHILDKILQSDKKKLLRHSKEGVRFLATTTDFVPGPC